MKNMLKKNKDENEIKEKYVKKILFGEIETIQGFNK